MNITYVIASLTCGGAERVMSHLANYYVERGEDVTLITLDEAKNDFYRLDSRVDRVALGLLKDSSGGIDAVKNNVRRILALRKAISTSRPDVVVSFIHMNNVITLLSTIGLNVPVIVSERIDTRQWPIGFFWERLRRLLYPLASAVVVQTESMQQWASDFVREDRLFTIPNPVINIADQKTNHPHSRQLENEYKPFVAAMGRLSTQKGFDFLLEAFSRCQNKNWSLLILGEGDELENLKSQAKDLGVDSRVHFVGKVSEPQRILKDADIFVLSSRFEGFPNALLEAMSLGLPVISTDCPSGPSEIVKNNVSGLLVNVDDVDSLTHALERLMQDDMLRARLGASATSVLDQFSIKKVVTQWDQLMPYKNGPVMTMQNL